ncbi:MAG: DUF2079 domain-containing protein [Candidatus Omnitrophica bacterium]|nr:DUF2079 domain-containing protein [Candidatus Omnitrophota bacterium]
MIPIRLPKDKWLILVIAGILIYTAVFTYLSILRYDSFFSYEWEDQATQHQLVWNTAHGRWFYNSIGVSGNFFSYHFQPFILLQALLYRIWPHIYTYFFLISFGLASGALPLYLFARKVFASSVPAALIALSYLFYAPLFNLNFCDGDQVIFTVPLFFTALYILEKNLFCFRRRSFLSFLCVITLALSCKEHIAFTVLLLGAYLLLQKKYKWGATCIISSVAWLIISMPVTLWLNHGQSLARCINYDSFKELTLLPFTKPHEFIRTFFSASHLEYFFKLSFPLAFLPFVSAVTFVSGADILLLLSGRGNIEYYQAYYIAPLIPFFFAGLVYSVKKISNHVSGKAVKIILVSILFLNILNLFGDNILGGIGQKKVIYDNRFIHARNIFDPVFYTMDEEDKLAWSFVAMIPDNASVSASGDLLVALSSREKLLELFNDDCDYLDSEYVLIHTRYMGFGGGNYCHKEEKAVFGLIEKMQSDPSWLKLREEGNFILFKRRFGEKK